MKKKLPYPFQIAKEQVLTLLGFPYHVDDQAQHEFEEQVAPILQEGRENLIILMTRVPFTVAVLLFISYLLSAVPKNTVSITLYTIVIVTYGVMAFLPNVAFRTKLFATAFLFEAAAIADLFNYGIWLFGPLFLFVNCIYALVFGGAKRGLIVVAINTFIIFLSGALISLDIYMPPVAPFPEGTFSMGVSALFAFQFFFAVLFSHAMISALLSFIQRAWRTEREIKSALERQTEALEEASQRKDAFLATMSHELRTPLNTILTRTQAIEKGVYGDINAKQLRSIQGIEVSGKHLLSLIEDVLNVSKIASGEMGLILQQVNITAVCRECISSIFPIASQKNIKVKTEYESQVTLIDADRLRIRQILFNLLSNAVKFTDNDKKIGVITSTNQEDQTVSICVWDEGIGIPESAHSHLFEPFTQVDNSLSRNYEGTGLGLTLVQQLARLHNGDVEVTSEEGVGTRFTVTLPMKQTHFVIPEKGLLQ